MLRLSQLPRSLAVALLATACFVPLQVLAGPSVDISMKAAFPSPPYLVELLETAAQENATCYLPLLDRIAKGEFATAATDKQLYEKFLDVLRQDGHVVSPETMSTFKLALSMRSAVPRIEAHYQYYQTAVEPYFPRDQGGCDSWFLLEGRQYCGPQLEKSNGQVEDKTQGRFLPFDRPLGSGSLDIVLYANVASPEFGQYHEAAMEALRNSRGSYRVRYKRSPYSSSEALPVNGYGVELALKRTDYIVIDDREAEEGGEEAQKAISSEVVLDAEEEVADLKPLSTSELSSLGMKTASFILQSENPFDTLVKLTQDFPKYSTSVATHNVSLDFEVEHLANHHQVLPTGVNVLVMNGVQLIERQIEPFTLVDMLRRERKMINGVLDLGLTGKEAVSLLGHSEVASVKAEEDTLRFDWRDTIEEGKVIIWLNDPEKDSRYAEYPSTIRSLLQPSMPGAIPSLRRTVFTVVIPLDLSRPEDVTVVVEQLVLFVKRELPVRFGLVPLVPTPEAVEQAKMVYHLVENYGLTTMAAYLRRSLEGKKTSMTDQAIFAKAIEDRTLRPDATPLPFQEISGSEYHDKQAGLAKHWAERLSADSTVPPVFVNGLPINRDETWVQAMSQRLGQDLRTVQEGVFYGLINDDTWIPGYFLEKAVSRRNIYIYPEDGKSLTVLDVNKMYTEHQDLFGAIPILEAGEDLSKENWATLTVVADLEDGVGKTLLVDALKFLEANPGIRLDIVHNPADGKRSAHQINAHLKANENKLSNIKTTAGLEALVRETDTTDEKYDASLAAFLADASMRPGDNRLILNGRVIGPITAAAGFGEADFEQFLESERANRILPVYKALDDLGLGGKVSGPLAAAKLTSVTALSTISDVPEGIFESAPTLRITPFDVWNSTYTAFEVGDASTATIHFVAIVNPASEQGQRWAPILKVLSELDGVHMKVFLNPKDQLEELPVKRFFRYVLNSAPTFDDAGKVKPLSATFKGLPSEALLTAGMDVPPAWLVSSKVSVHDLDNIKLSSIKSNVEAVYGLENILIEGHSREPERGPPRGVQLVLNTEKNPHSADTIIMSNLGFFQFKANPGFYNIQLTEGRSSEIFEIESVGAHGFHPVPGDNGTEVALMDFMGTTLYPRLVRRPGMETEEVLEEVTKPESVGASAMEYMSRGLKFAEGILGGGSKDKTDTKTLATLNEDQAEINIFSVASGHLYERMLNIMMVSVMRHTNHTVKFWFIEQFLSPSFKDFIPYMAAEYGFKYEMVTYKWPHWLRQQKEKQREIWGYKILFLDVLFPLSLDKVIFVDADQIVRTDMYDLVQHDLEGAPYGFTPMCDSRAEMEGFRFWKQGYWETYLRGLPYHISALYVVDLRRFRELAAGDRLRQTYHTLSADPASLANLDQDLPNHMQFNIPIHSLPQEWLWCETWCSDESLTEARTIDLCNNPLTKEPKLDRARRQVPEWTVYDNEIAALDKRRKGLPPVEGGTSGVSRADGQAQQVLGGGGGGEHSARMEKNPKSRRLDDEVVKAEHQKDEL